MHATKQLCDAFDELEVVGPQCNLRDIDLGIAVGSAAKTAAIHSSDARMPKVDLDSLDQPSTGTLPK